MAEVSKTKETKDFEECEPIDKNDFIPSLDDAMTIFAEYDNTVSLYTQTTSEREERSVAPDLELFVESRKLYCEKLPEGRSGENKAVILFTNSLRCVDQLAIDSRRIQANNIQNTVPHSVKESRKDHETTYNRPLNKVPAGDRHYPDCEVACSQTDVNPDRESSGVVLRRIGVEPGPFGEQVTTPGPNESRQNLAESNRDGNNVIMVHTDNVDRGTGNTDKVLHGHNHGMTKRRHSSANMAGDDLIGFAKKLSAKGSNEKDFVKSSPRNDIDKNLENGLPSSVMKSSNNNNDSDFIDSMSKKSPRPTITPPSHGSVSLPNTPRDPPLNDSKPTRRPRRYSLADISNMGLSVVQDQSFAREIRQHQLLLQNKHRQPPICEQSDKADVEETNESACAPSKTADLTSPDERARYLQRRRASQGSIPHILPNLHLPRSPSISKSSSLETVSTATPLISVTVDEEVPSSPKQSSDDSTMSNAESERRLAMYRRSKRRSSWACTGTHSNVKPISTLTLLRETSYHGGSEPSLKAYHDPYRLTVHFITDPGQSDKLRNLLRPLTKAIVSRLAIFNYAERSVNASVLPPDDDQNSILALAIVVFIEEEVGADRLVGVQRYLQHEPWALHHRSELGPNAAPYPTNNQDYYAHADNMPLWAVRQVHCGKDRLRCQLFVSDEHWIGMMQLYATLLGHGVQYQREDFCYFVVYESVERNLEIQLALKRLPAAYTPLPLEDVILQFKVDDIGLLVPILPNVCSPISEKRWQTTDLDGNKILLLLRKSDKSGRSTPCRSEAGDVSVSPALSGVSSNGSDESVSTSDNERHGPTRQRGNHRHLRKHSARRNRDLTTTV
ncbi:uncharacterized protein [Diadema antillarum]|uniref:uncharacterized protein n=1 Tax=Diadema antillarum TaxID=105358 RepID=UPI003A841C5F